jgi:hypothetical protein
MKGFSEKPAGWALIAGGASLAAFGILTSPFASFSGVETALNPLQLVAQGFHLAASPLLALGLVPLAQQRMRSGLAATFGTIATMAGLFGFFGDGVIGGVIDPILATAHPAAIAADGAMFVGPILTYYVATFATLMVGLLLCGWALARASAPNFPAIALMTAGGIAMNLPPIPTLHLVQAVGAVALGGAFAWLGVDLARAARG